MFVFFYASAPKLVCFLVLGILIVGTTPILVHRGELIRSADSSGPLLSTLLTVSCIWVGAGGLRTYYAHVQPMMALSSMRAYSNVFPQQPGLAFNDAAYVEFASSTSVDVSKAISFKSLSSGFYTFCAAPIVDAQNTGHVEFWAVGVDCCGAAGSFQCDSASESGAQKGWVMRPPDENDILYDRLGKYLAPPQTRRDLLTQTMHKAEGLYEITSGDEPVLVRWTNKSKDDLLHQERVAIALSLLGEVATAALIAAALTALYQRFTSLHHLHDRLAFPNDLHPTRPSHHTARILTFFQTVSTLDRVPLPPIKYEDVCLMSVVVPYVVLISCLLLWSFAYCSRFGNWIVTPVVVLLLVFIAVLLMTPHRCMQGGSVLIVALVGTCIGMFNWDNNMFHYCLVESHRSYSNVFADADALEYLDAGKLHFQESARPINEWSVGFKRDENMYCVSPVVACSEGDSAGNTGLIQTSEEQDATDDAAEEASGDASSEAISLVESKVKRSRRRFRLMMSQKLSVHAVSNATGSRGPASCDGRVPTVPPRIEFWAVGKNCCSSTGDFWCHETDWQDRSAKSAVVVYAFQGENMDKRSPWNYYQRAVRKASDNFDLPLPDHPMLLRWGRDVDELNHEWMNKAIGIVLLTSVAGLLSILAFAMVIFCAAKQQRRNQAKDRAQRAAADPD